MKNKIYITDSFYLNIEDKIKSKLIDKVKLKRIKIHVEDLGLITTKDLKDEIYQISKNIFIKRVFNKTQFAFIKKDNNFYLFDCIVNQ